MTKTALITGSSGGIGMELARINAEMGIDLVLVARTKSKLDELKKELEEKFKIKVYTIQKDLSLQTAALEVYDEVKRQEITIDYLINNAGFGDIEFFADSNWDKQERMINLNVMTLTHLTWLFLKDMVKQRSGKILNLASTASFQPGPTMSVYFASKAFVLSFSEALYNEVRDKGISVTALCPGSTESAFHAVAMGDKKKIRERDLPSARWVAEIGFRAMMKGKTVVIPGLKNSLMTFSVRILPRNFIVKAVRRIQQKKF